MKHIYIAFLLLIGVSNSTFSQQTFYSSFTDPTGHYKFTVPSILVLGSLGTFTNPQNVASGDGSQFATYTSILDLSLLGIGTPFSASVDFNLFQYAYMSPGSKITWNVSMPGILQASLLNATTITTYINGINGTAQESSGTTNLLQVNLLGLGNNTYAVSFIPTKNFDAAQISIDQKVLGLGLGSSYSVYPAAVTGIAGGTALPVNLSSFTSTVKNNAVVLNWVTTLENNNRGFYVERSADNKTFSSIGFVKSQATNGNSNSVINYAFTDNNPSSGTNYYRLQQVDISNASKYSATISQTINNLALKLFPNPAKSYLTVSGAAANTQFIITSLFGQVVQTSNSPNINIANLPAGIYFLQAVTNGGKKTLKFVKE